MESYTFPRDRKEKATLENVSLDQQIRLSQSGRATMTRNVIVTLLLTNNQMCFCCHSVDHISCLYLSMICLCTRFTLFCIADLSQRLVCQLELAMHVSKYCHSDDVCFIEGGVDRGLQIDRPSSQADWNHRANRASSKATKLFLRK